MGKLTGNALATKAAVAAILLLPDIERDRVRALLADDQKWNLEATIDNEGWITIKIISAVLRIHENAIGEGPD